VKPLLAFFRQLAGLFFDDGSLAITVLVILGVTAFLLQSAWIDRATAMVFLAGGVIAALLENVTRTARTSPPKD
jgi:hypothetical protein